MWAIAEQKAGAHLGQAAPLLASLSNDAITDVVPQTIGTDVTGEITFGDDAADLSSFFYTAPEIFGTEIDPNAQFTSAVWNRSLTSQAYYEDIGFGLDGVLTVTQGWDNVTGYGTPNGLPFINAVAAAATAR